MVDIEEVNLTFLLLKKTAKSFSEIQNEVSRAVNKDETIAYIQELSLDDDLKNQIMNKVN